MYETARENRNKDTAKHLDRMADRDMERDRLQARVQSLEDQLVEARETGGNSTSDMEEQQQQQQQQIRALMTELTRTRGALAESQENYSEALTEISRLNLGRFSSAALFMNHCDRLLDPDSRLYETMVAIATYRDGAGPVPTEEQRADFRLFRDYLGERAEVLREAKELDDPRPALRAFDDKWAAEAARNDWGAMVTLRLSATRAATGDQVRH